MNEQTLFVPNYNIGQPNGLQHSGWFDTSFPFQDNGNSSNYSDYLTGNSNKQTTNNTKPFPWIWVIVAVLVVGGLYMTYSK